MCFSPPSQPPTTPPPPSVSQVETRGLSEEGIYRVSGSEKEVKALKERFLRGRGIPVLANTDIHVICGCIKDFLRNLREPLIPTRLWTSFSNAVQHHDDVAAVRDLYASIDRLPQANRDTLAYLILHLQRLVASHARPIFVSSTEDRAKMFKLCLFQSCDMRIGQNADREFGQDLWPNGGGLFERRARSTLDFHRNDDSERRK